MKLKISGIEGYDGEYDVDFNEFTNRELADIEAVAKVPLSKIEDGYFSIAVGVAVVILRRAGKPVVEDMLWNAKQGSVVVAGGDASPPELSPTPSKDGDQSS